MSHYLARAASSHMCAGDRLSLADDFMPALQARSAGLPSGASRLNWSALPEATRYYAWAIGAKGGRVAVIPDMVWWSSAGAQQFGGALAAGFTRGVAKFIAADTVFPAVANAFTIPAEVKATGGEVLMTQLFVTPTAASPSPTPGERRRSMEARMDRAGTVSLETSLMLGMPGAGWKPPTHPKVRSPRPLQAKCKGLRESPCGRQGCASRPDETRPLRPSSPLPLSFCRPVSLVARFVVLSLM